MINIIPAFLADLCFGDPVYSWHPVRMMGKVIERSELFLRRHMTHERLAGTLLAVSLPVIVFFFVWAVIFLLGRIHPFLSWIANVFGIYTALSVHDLREEGMRVYRDLRKNDLPQARKDLARIVGRDTRHLNEEEVVRACVETVAESTVDGIVAPLFYAALGGAPLALAYKAVNTLDSMIGYRNPRYKDFGFAAAKQDDIFNWIPARLSYGIIALAAWLCFIWDTYRNLIYFDKINKVTVCVPGLLKVGWKHGVAASFGNSAIPEAAFAGALGLQLGGRSVYEGKIIDKPCLGFPGRRVHHKVILESVRLMTASAWVAVLLCV